MLTRRIESTLTYAMLLAVAAGVLFPFIWLALTSVKTLPETFANPPQLFPARFVWGNFVVAWQRAQFSRVLLNTLWTVSATTALSVFLNSLAGYAFAMYRFRGQALLFGLVLATMMVPFQVVLTPLFLLMQKLALVNTYAGLILPRAADAFGIFMVRQYLKSLPRELTEAARVDGASEFRIYWQVIMPLAMPALAVLTITTFVWRWNDLLWPLIITTAPEMKTVQLALATFQGEFYVEWNYLLALTLISLLPMVAVFFAFQRHFIKGISLTGMK